MPSKIDEELRQYKLFKIQDTNVRLRQFQQAYNKIKENAAIKFSKNATFNLLKVAFLLLPICFLVITICCFLPGEFILLIEEYEGRSLSPSDKKDIVIIFKYLKFIFFAIAAIFYLLSYLLKLNNRKRNTIYSLSHLLEEMINYLEKSSDEEKRKYEQYVDFLAKNEKSSSAKNNNP